MKNYFNISILLFMIICSDGLWTKHYLTYSIEGDTPFTKIIDDAIKEWNFTSIQVNKVKSGKGDIKIHFEFMDDNRIGYGYFPPVGEIKIKKHLLSYDLKPVIQHEFGHALGLGHNHDNRSIMFFLKLDTIAIKKEDVINLDDLYKCRYDSVTLLNYKTYLMFKGTHYERFDFHDNSITKGEIWESSIVKVDAMYRNGGTYVIISGDKYYEFDANMKFMTKGDVVDKFPMINDKINAVLTLHNNSIIAFLENHYIWFDGKIMHASHKFKTFPYYQKLQGAYIGITNDIMLVVKDYMWIYDMNFNYKLKIRMCDEGKLNIKLHCCNKFSNI